MTILGIVALILLVVFGIMVLRVKSDPMEKDSIRKYLADAKSADKNAAPVQKQSTDSVPPPPGK